MYRLIKTAGIAECRFLKQVFKATRSRDKSRVVASRGSTLKKFLKEHDHHPKTRTKTVMNCRSAHVLSWVIIG